MTVNTITAERSASCSCAVAPQGLDGETAVVSAAEVGGAQDGQDARSRHGCGALALANHWPVPQPPSGAKSIRSTRVLSAVVLSKASAWAAQS